MTRPPALSDHERAIRHQVQHEAKVMPSAVGPSTFADARVLVMNGRLNIHARPELHVHDDAGMRLGFASSTGEVAGRGVRDALRIGDPDMRRHLLFRSVDGSTLRFERHRLPGTEGVVVYDEADRSIGEFTRRAGLRRQPVEIAVEDMRFATMHEQDHRARRWLIRGTDEAEIGRVEKTPSLEPTLLGAELRFVVERRTEVGSPLDLLLGVAPLALTLMFLETYEDEDEVSLARDPGAWGRRR